MMQIVPRWKVTIRFPDREVVIYVNDNFIANVLRTVASLDFTGTMEQPTSITIG